jgi:hypothetical protein
MTKNNINDKFEQTKHWMRSVSDEYLNNNGTFDGLRICKDACDKFELRTEDGKIPEWVRDLAIVNAKSARARQKLSAWLGLRGMM